MKKFIVLLLSCFLILVVGCSKGNQEKDSLDKQEKIEVTIQTPEKINPNEEISIEALVTQEGEKIEDADEVQFEIGKSGRNIKGCPLWTPFCYFSVPACTGTAL